MNELQNMKHVELVLEFINTTETEERIGLLYNKYGIEKKGHTFSYKTWQRTIQELAERELITIRKVIGGAVGTTTIISKL